MNKLLNELVKDFFSSDYTGHDYSHTLRVYNMAMHIAETEECNLEVVELASMLHDVDDRKLSDTYKELSNAKGIMNKLGISKDTIERLCKVISEVSFKANDSIKPSTIEGMIVQDADRLDAIGAIGIARCFQYGGAKKRVLYDPKIKPRLNMNEEEYFNHENTTINHFYEKLLLLKDMMNTKEGYKIACHRHQVLENFLDEFIKEWNFK